MLMLLLLLLRYLRPEWFKRPRPQQPPPPPVYAGGVRYYPPLLYHLTVRGIVFEEDPLRYALYVREHLRNLGGLE